MLARRNTRVRKNRSAVVVLATLVAALLALAVPALASAAPFTVDGAGDAPKSVIGPSCITAEGTCTLRAAIEATNAEPDADTIGFSSAVFDGTVEIEPASELPAITEPVTISGESQPFGTLKGPSVGVITPNGARGLRVQADDVTVEKVAIGGGGSGIEVAEGSERFTASGDWFGLLINGNPAPIQVRALVIEPGADGAIIGAGEDETETRNVFTNSLIGVEVTGASKTKILGNYIGVGPDGAGPATLNQAVYVNDGPAAKAEETEIGGLLSSTEAGTPACDGACNVIATEGGPGIAIFGETAAAGHGTVVRGNFVGLEADGVTPVGETADDVNVAPLGACGEGPEVTVGGTAPTETNHLVGGNRGIYAEGAENFTAAGNAIGIDADGEPSLSPEVVGIQLCAEGVTTTAHLTGNQMALAEGVMGIESLGGHAEIVGNTIKGGIAGIFTGEDDKGAGDLIQGNTITDVERQGIELANDSNVVIGNTITRADWAGIALDGHTTLNRIGGDAPGEANTIVESGLRGEEEDGAITMFTRRGLRNEFAANTGFGNFGAFIKLFVNNVSEGEIANGIAPPTIAVGRQSSASGTTAPEATVRVYAKASAEPGELGAQLAVVKADAAGNWKANFAKQAVGGLITATATREAGTSELAAPVAAVADPEEEKGGGGGEGGGDSGGGGNSGGDGGGGTGGGSSGSGSSSPAPKPAPVPSGPVAKVAPKMRITSGPKKTSKATTAKFKFKVTNVSGAKFECKLDGAKWASCKSPKGYKKLKPGKHTFKVRAKANGLTGAVTKYQFTITS